MDNVRKFVRRVILRGGKFENYRAVRNLSRVHHSINRRAAVRRAIDSVAVGGRVASVRSGMDCDCTQYFRKVTIDVPESLMKWQRDEDHHQSYLDGPESQWWEAPGEDEFRSADRALEAYENGHPSVVYFGDLR